MQRLAMRFNAIDWQAIKPSIVQHRRMKSAKRSLEIKAL